MFNLRFNSSIQLVPTLLFCLLFCQFELAGQNSSPNKKALLIGVSSYPETGGWNAINSNNDIQLVHETLLSKGFGDQNINILQNEKATKSAILKSLKTDLVNTCNAGDICYFQFSGHGQQMQDNSGDEIDGYDECLVPYDSPKKFDAVNNTGQFLITDDELNNALTALREKLGPKGHLIVVLDACHSGTGTRGFVQARGTTELMANPEYVEKANVVHMAKEFNELNKQNSLKPNSKPLAPYVAFFGSAQHQLNYEMEDAQGKHYGSLTYALTKTLANSNQNESYRELFENIRIEMAKIAPLQNPQAEGDLDIEVMNGKNLGKSEFFTPYNINSEVEFMINAGQLLGINEGSIIGLYDASTRSIENGTPIAKGKVVSNLPTTAKIIMDTPVEMAKILKSRVFVIEKSFGTIKISVQIQTRDTALNTQLKQELGAKSFIKLVDRDADLLLGTQNSRGAGNAVTLKSKANYTIDSLNYSSSLNFPIELMMRRLRKYMQAEFFKNLELEGRSLNVSFKIVPNAQLKDNPAIESIKGLEADASGQKSMKIDDSFWIIVSNQGTKPAYFSLIDIQPDNIINQLLPGDHFTPEEMRILPGEIKLIPLEFKIGAPLGNEMFKLIASDKPMDLKPITGTRGNQKQSPIEKLFNDSFSEEFYQTRGGSAVNFNSSDLNTATETFIIIQN